MLKATPELARTSRFAGRGECATRFRASYLDTRHVGASSTLGAWGFRCVQWRDGHACSERRCASNRTSWLPYELRSEIPRGIRTVDPEPKESGQRTRFSSSTIERQNRYA